MCIQIVERYTECHCLYYKHAVDPCPTRSHRGHVVEVKNVLVGYTCAKHSNKFSLPTKSAQLDFSLDQAERIYAPLSKGDVKSKISANLVYWAVLLSFLMIIAVIDRIDRIAIGVLVGSLVINLIAATVLNLYLGPFFRIRSKQFEAKRETLASLFAKSSNYTESSKEDIEIRHTPVSLYRSLEQADSITGYKTNSTQLSNLKQSDGEPAVFSADRASPTEQDAAVVAAAQVDDLLRAIQRWTDTSGDTSVLSWLSKSVRNLSEQVKGRPGQSGENHASERCPDPATTRSDREHTTDSLQPSSCGNGRESIGTKDADGQGRLNLKVAHETHTRRAKMRCPLLFSEGMHLCHTTHKYIRDLTRHLKCHGLFFCSKCSQHFVTGYELDTHACERVCIHLGCVNRKPETIHYVHQAGCPFSFDSLDTPQKWYALYALVLPGSKQPPWEYVYVSDESLCTETASNAVHTIPFQPAAIPMAPIDSQAEYDNDIPSTFNGGRGFEIENNHDLPMDNSVAENMAHVVLEQIMTIMSGSRRQNDEIMRQDETISQQNQQIYIQNNTIASLEGEVRNLRDEIAELRAFALSFSQAISPQNGLDIPGAPIEIDTSSSNESNMDISDDGTSGSYESNETGVSDDEPVPRTPADILVDGSASKPKAHGCSPQGKEYGHWID